MSTFKRCPKRTIQPPFTETVAPASPDPLAAFFLEVEAGFRRREDELAQEAAREAARRVRALYAVEPATEDEWIQGGMVELRPRSAPPEAPDHDDEDGEVTNPGFRLAGATP